MRIAGKLLVVVLPCVAAHSAHSARAQERRVVTGVVADVSDHPVPLARIQNGKETATADDSGRFRIVVQHRDKVTFDVTRLGFMPSRFGLAPGGDTTVTILILPAAKQLEKVTVTSTETDLALDRSGFARRLKERENGTNSGIFITAADIDRRNPSRISAMFEDLPGVTVCRNNSMGTCGMFGNHLIPNQSGRGFVKCPITVYVDGQRLDAVPGIINDRTRALDIDAFVLPQGVAGMEYYPSGNRVPSQFQLLNGSCGLVLVWTRRG